jgi:hypothetical protein
MGSQEGGGEGGGRRSSLDDGPVTAAFWTASIELLNVVDNISMPSEKLRVLIRVVESIFAEAGRRGCPGLGADDFFPIFTLVIIRANLRHPQTTVSACALSGCFGGPFMISFRPSSTTRFADSHHTLSFPRPPPSLSFSFALFPAPRVLSLSLLIFSSSPHLSPQVSLLDQLVDLDTDDQALPESSSFCVVNFQAALSYIMDMEIPMDIRLNEAGGGGYKG